MPIAEQEALRQMLMAKPNAVKNVIERVASLHAAGVEPEVAHRHLTSDDLSIAAQLGAASQNDLPPWMYALASAEPLKFYWNAEAVRSFNMPPIRLPLDGWLRDVGARLWEFTYKRFPGDDDFCAMAASNIWLTRKNDIPGKVHELLFLLVGPSIWADGAFTSITTTHKYFAALASTTLNDETYADVRLPWPAFVVQVPNGMIVASNGAEYTRIEFVFLREVTTKTETSEKSKRNWCGLRMTSEDGKEALHCHRLGERSLVEVLFDGELPVDEVISTEEQRLLQTAKRAVVGLLYAIQFTDNFKSRTAPRKPSKWEARTGPPDHRVVFVGAPISVDCRAALREYHHHGSKNRPPSVQVLVRGHYKRQVIGIGRTGRQVVWIEPYWRGPEDAPILARPRMVGAP